MRFMKICARSALILGAAALWLSGTPAHANPASEALPQESPPRLLAQSKAQPAETEQLKKPPLEEQQKKVQESPQPSAQPKRARMRGAAPEVDPAKSNKSRFGAGVIRKSEKPVDSE